MRVVTEQVLADAFAALPEEEPRVVASGNAASPAAALRVLDGARERYRLFVLNALHPLPDREGVVLETPFVGAGMRRRANLEYVPARLSLVPELFRSTRVPDVVVLSVSPPRDRTVSLGAEVNVLPAALEAVRERGGLVVAQVNRHVPYTYGDGVLGVDEVDLALEVDEPLASPAHGAPDDLARGVAEQVAPLVPERATLQLGIGGAPDAVVDALSARRGLRVWTELLGDGVLRLERAGALAPEETLTASFLLGGGDLYTWADGNPRLRVLRTERVNDPATISRQPAMTSVNTALQVDLFAQANASRRPGRPGEVYSGFGGQTDFVVGALHATGGVAVVALPSWHPRADTSTVVEVCDVVTSFQHSHLVSEQGVARVFGSSQDEQARQVVEHVAHPHARDGLREAAGRLGLRL